MSDDITAAMVLDTADYIGPIQAARAETAGFFSYIVDAGKTALTAVGSELASISVAIYEETKSVLLDVAHEWGQFALSTAIGVGATGAAVGGITSYFAGFWQTMRIGLSVASWFVPWLKVATVALAAGTAATWAYQKANEATDGELTKSILNFSQTSAAVEKVKESFTATATSAGIVGDGIASVGANAFIAIAKFSGLTTAIEGVDYVLAGSVNSVNTFVEDWNVGFQIMTDTASDWLSTSGAGAAQLRDMAAASEALMAKQMEQAEFFRTLRAVQMDAADAAEHHREMQRIGAIDSADAINVEINALQQRAAAMRIAGEVSEAETKRIAELFRALEMQRVKIDAGDMQKPEKQSDAQTAIAQAERSLMELRVGRDAAALAALEMAGATREEIAELRTLQEESAAAKAAKEAEQEAAKRAREEADKQQLLNDQAADRIAKLRDELDLMTGSATKADIAMRQMLREGYSTDQAREIAAITEEMDAAQAEKNAAKGKSASATKAAFAAMNSKEAYSSILNATQGDKTPEKETAKNTARLVKLYEQSERQVNTGRNTGPTLNDLGQA